MNLKIPQRFFTSGKYFFNERTRKCKRPIFTKKKKKTKKKLKNQTWRLKKDFFHKRKAIKSKRFNDEKIRFSLNEFRLVWFHGKSGLYTYIRYRVYLSAMAMNSPPWLRWLTLLIIGYSLFSVDLPSAVSKSEI